MRNQASTPEAPPLPPAPVFRSVICGVDQTRASEPAARLAATLTVPGGRLDLVAVVGEPTQRLRTAQVLLTRAAAEQALRRATRTARDAGADPVGRIVEAGPDRHPLVRAAAGHDLLVVGSHGGGRGEGILGASMATASVHEAPCPVLVARDGPPFPGTVLLADDGGTAAGEAARVTAALAARHGCHVFVAAPGLLDRQHRHRLAEDCLQVRSATGREPVIVDVEGPPARMLPVLAERLEISMIVLGSRGRLGVRALASVSERVAHDAPCSVLIVRNCNDRDPGRIHVQDDCRGM